MLGQEGAQCGQLRTFTQIGLEDGCHSMGIELSRIAMNKIKVGTCKHNSNKFN
jgi:hypothetical protein